MSKQAGYVRCAFCDRDKAPVGRSVPLEMWSALCSSDRCVGYYAHPIPVCRWPGEETCGPGCTWGELAPAAEEGKGER